MAGIALFILAFSALGGLMAFLITYEEMRHHLKRRGALAAAARTGLVTFLVLGVLALAGGWLLRTLSPA